MKYSVHTAESGGFTLMEVLLVVAILGILSSILVPVLSSARESSKRAVCGQNLHNISIALGAYAGDWQMKLPGPYYNNSADTTDDDLSALVPLYTDDVKIFVCPATLHKVKTVDDITHSAPANNTAGMSYEYINKASRRWGQVPVSVQGPCPVLHDTDNTGDTKLVDGEDNHWKLKGGNGLMPDGSVEFIDADDWENKIYNNLP